MTTSKPAFGRIVLKISGEGLAGPDGVGLDTALGGGQMVFHAGTAQTGDAIVTSGGRVLCMLRGSGGDEQGCPGNCRPLC